MLIFFAIHVIFFTCKAVIEMNSFRHSKKKKSKKAEMDSATQKSPNWYITCVYVQKITLRQFLRPHLASGSLRFEKCRTLVIKSVGTYQLWIINEGMRLISQKMRVGTPMAPLQHRIWRPQTASYRAMEAYSSLMTTWMSEMCSTTQKPSEKTYHSFSSLNTTLGG